MIFLIVDRSNLRGHMKYILKVVVLLLLFTACSSQQTLKMDTPAPGTAYVEGKIIEAVDWGNSIELNFHVDKIYAYGSATKPIAPGSELKLSVSKSSKKKSFEDFKKFVNDKSSLLAQIAQPSQVMNGESSNVWKVVFIKEKQ